MEKIFSTTLRFSESEMGILAGMYLGRVKDYEEMNDPANAARCEAMAAMFISYMPIEFQNGFREVVQELLDSGVNPTDYNAISQKISTIIERRKK